MKGHPKKYKKNKVGNITTWCNIRGCGIGSLGCIKDCTENNFISHDKINQIVYCKIK